MATESGRLLIGTGLGLMWMLQPHISTPARRLQHQIASDSEGIETITESRFPERC
jgi:hypothetical protein